MGQAITEIGTYAGTISDTTKLPVSDSDTLQAATAAQLKTYMNIPSAVTVDSTPTDGSSNAVSSNGVFDALALKQDASSAFNPATPGAIGATTPSTINATAVTATGATVAGGTVTASAPVANFTQTWNSAGVTFTAKDNNITNTASATGSILENWRVGGSSVFRIEKDGRIVSAMAWNQAAHNLTTITPHNINGWWFLADGSSGGAYFGSGMQVAWKSSTSTTAASGMDTGLSRISAGLVGVGTGTAGSFAGSLKATNLISSGGVITPSAYTTATRPAWVNGNVIFDSDLDKLVIGGVTAWEVVTSV